MGVWRPDPPSLARIREAIVERPDRWRRARNDKKFRSRFALEGDVLRSAPRGFPPDHPLLEDLKRKDFVGVCEMSEQAVLADDFVDVVETSFAASRAPLRFLCEALSVPF